MFVTAQRLESLWLILPLSGSSLRQVEHLPRVQIPHEGLDDLGSLKNGRGKKTTFEVKVQNDWTRMTKLFGSIPQSVWSASLTHPSSIT